jgi:hypothetical protein
MSGMGGNPWVKAIGTVLKRGSMAMQGAAGAGQSQPLGSMNTGGEEEQPKDPQAAPPSAMPLAQEKSRLSQIQGPELGGNQQTELPAYDAEIINRKKAALGNLSEGGY